MYMYNSDHYMYQGDMWQVTPVWIDTPYTRLMFYNNFMGGRMLYPIPMPSTVVPF